METARDLAFATHALNFLRGLSAPYQRKVSPEAFWPSYGQSLSTVDVNG